LRPAHPPSPWQRFRRKLRDDGPLHTALVILNSLVPRPLLDVRVWIVSSADFSAFVDAEVPDVGVHWNIEADDDSPAAPVGEHAAIEDKLARGELAAVIERDGRVVAWDTFATGVFVKEDWLWFAFLDNEIYSSWSFVEPDYRGRGLAVGLALYAYRELARRGYLRDYSVTDALNRSALSSSAKVRHLPIGRIAYVRCCGLAVIRINRQVRAGYWSANNPLVIDFNVFDDREIFEDGL